VLEVDLAGRDNRADCREPGQAALKPPGLDIANRSIDAMQGLDLRRLANAGAGTTPGRGKRSPVLTLMQEGVPTCDVARLSSPSFRRTSRRTSPMMRPSRESFKVLAGTAQGPDVNLSALRSHIRTYAGWNAEEWSNDAWD
jgi:hypothetical protein